MNSRRDFFRLAGLTTVGGSAVLLAACADDDDENAPVLETPTERDIRLLNSALDLENTAIVAYGVGAQLLGGRTLELGRQILAHEREHAAALTRAIKGLGGNPTTPRRQEEILRQFPNLSSPTDVLRFAVDLENAVIEAYLDALPKLSRPTLRRTVGAIVSSEAEHISVLLGALNPGDPSRAGARGVRDRRGLDVMSNPVLTRREVVVMAVAQASGDAVLEELIRLEQRAVVAYTAAKSVTVARLFAEQSQQHADALTRALRARGGSPPAQPTGAADAPGLADALELESTAVAAYYNALGRVKAPELLPTLASIMANRAQHLVVLRQQLGRNPLPDAFVTGS